MPEVHQVIGQLFALEKVKFKGIEGNFFVPGRRFFLNGFVQYTIPVGKARFHTYMKVPYHVALQVPFVPHRPGLRNQGVRRKGRADQVDIVQQFPVPAGLPFLQKRDSQGADK